VGQLEYDQHDDPVAHVYVISGSLLTSVRPGEYSPRREKAEEAEDQRLLMPRKTFRHKKKRPIAAASEYGTKAVTRRRRVHPNSTAATKWGLKTWDSQTRAPKKPEDYL
jgi:hypothetical protein